MKGLLLLLLKVLAEKLLFLENKFTSSVLDLVAAAFFEISRVNV